jgi:hypothetical protein
MHSGDSASNHSIDEDTAEITFKPQVSDESNVLEGEGTPAGTEEVQDIKGMSPETLTVYLEYRERLLERQQRVQDILKLFSPNYLR